MPSGLSPNNADCAPWPLPLQVPCKDWTIAVTVAPTKGQLKPSNLWPTGTLDYVAKNNPALADSFKYKVTCNGLVSAHPNHSHFVSSICTPSAMSASVDDNPTAGS